MIVNTYYIDKALKFRREITSLISSGNYAKAKFLTKQYVNYCKKHGINP